MKKSLFLIPLFITVVLLLSLTDCTHHSSGGNYGLLYSNLDPNVTYYTVEEAVEYIKSLDKEKDETYTIHVKDDTETSCSSLYSALCSLPGATAGTFDENYIYEGPKIILDIENTVLDVSAHAAFFPGADIWCYSLKEIILPKNCTVIGDQAFGKKAGLEKVTFPECLITIKDMAFFGCLALKEIDLSNTQVKEIEENAFAMNNSDIFYPTVLESVKLPDTLETLGKQVFQNCTALTTITFPKSVRTIGRRVFYLCSNLKNITIESDSGKIWGHNPTYSKSSSDNYGELTETATKDNTTIVNCFEENLMYFLADDSVEEEPKLTCKCDCDEEETCTCKELSREGNPTNSGGFGDKWGCNYWWYRVSEQ